MFLSPESVRVASAVAAQWEHAQELLDGGRHYCQVWSFSPRSEEFRTSSGEFSSSLGILTLEFKYPKYNY